MCAFFLSCFCLLLLIVFALVNGFALVDVGDDACDDDDDDDGETEELLRISKVSSMKNSIDKRHFSPQKKILQVVLILDSVD